MIINLITYWKKDDSKTGYDKYYPAVILSSPVENWHDITGEKATTIHTGDNLVILHCEVSTDQLAALHASSDCFVLRIDGVAQSRDDLAAWLIGQGVDITKYANANFATDAELQTTIDQHKLTKQM